MTLESLLADALDEPQVTVVDRWPCGGGCISEAEKIQLADGRQFFVKSHPQGMEMFREEARGLEALAKFRTPQHPRTPRVPRVIATGEPSTGPCLILEFIDSPNSPPEVEFFENFGRQVAELHRQSVQQQYGWPSQNFIGSTPQVNTWSDSWVEFFRDHRLHFQLNLARKNRHSTPELEHSISALCLRLDDLLDTSDGASLLHGDLWSGNYMADENGRPVLIDPAVYYGHREAELSMTQLFGGFPEAFYSAYDEAWPLQEGWQDRVLIYQLYHLMNHLNLFGNSYLSSCLRIAQRFS